MLVFKLEIAVLAFSLADSADVETLSLISFHLYSITFNIIPSIRNIILSSCRRFDALSLAVLALFDTSVVKVPQVSLVFFDVYSIYYSHCSRYQKLSVTVFLALFQVSLVHF